MEGWREPATVSARAAAQARTTAQAFRAGALVLQTMRQARHFFRNLEVAFETQVIHSHSNHIPLLVRDAATVLFWLPEHLVTVLRMPVNSVYWEEFEAPLTLVLAYVVNQVDINDLPCTAETIHQYKQFMLAWAALVDQPRRGSQTVCLELVLASLTHTGHLQAHRV